MKKKSELELANRLEGVLKNYIHCDYTELGVKANDDLLKDWRLPIGIALGCKLTSCDGSDRFKINQFCGSLQGAGIRDILEKHEYYGYESQDVAFNYIEKKIDELENILKSKINED